MLHSNRTLKYARSCKLFPNAARYVAPLGKIPNNQSSVKHPPARRLTSKVGARAEPPRSHSTKTAGLARKGLSTCDSSIHPKKRGAPGIHRPIRKKAGHRREKGVTGRDWSRPRRGATGGAATAPAAKTAAESMRRKGHEEVQKPYLVFGIEGSGKSTQNIHIVHTYIHTYTHPQGTKRERCGGGWGHSCVVASPRKRHLQHKTNPTITDRSPRAALPPLGAHLLHNFVHTTPSHKNPVTSITHPLPPPPKQSTITRAVFYPGRSLTL